MISRGLYILNERRMPVAETDVEKWAKWFETADRRVALTDTDDGQISTVFLSVVPTFSSRPPQFWETMVFNTNRAWPVKRCSGSWEQAEMMHAEMVELVTGKKWEPEVKPE